MTWGKWKRVNSCGSGSRCVRANTWICGLLGLVFIACSDDGLGKGGGENRPGDGGPDASHVDAQAENPPDGAAPSQSATTADPGSQSEGSVPTLDGSAAETHDTTGSSEATDGDTDGSASGIDAGVPETSCLPSRCTCPDPSSTRCCSEFIPYRREVIQTRAEARLNGRQLSEPVQREGCPPKATELVTKAELWSAFEGGCGGAGCHTGADLPTNPGLFMFTFESFDERPSLGDDAMRRITAPAAAMPPPPRGANDGSKRTCTDKWYTLGQRLLAFQNSGYAESFEVERCAVTVAEEAEACEQPTGGSGTCDVLQVPYVLPEEAALAQTNLGQCIPTAAVEPCADEDLRAKDALFASMKEFGDLPLSLRDTDLTSLDSATLAKHKVFSYSPTYTLFSDNAKKQRYLRVPVGKVIRYNETTKDFDIPDNTRFYKTFLKGVVDAQGNLGYRKIETRLIVVRNSREGIKSLRATYAWNEDERDAILVRDPRNDGQPWADRMCAVIVNETLTRDPELNPISESVDPNLCDYMSREQMEEPSSGQIRHYGIPGSNRCDECHMGSNNGSYVLGFSPWQADHRVYGHGGTYDEVHEDELRQLKRFLEYGVIEGIQPGEAKLEESQGKRKPRNAHELEAQGYMIGNCAYCHNPNGFPSIQNPALKSFNLYPSSDGEGGIFQFPVDKASPRIRVGADQTRQVPYITAQWGNGTTQESSLKVVNVPDVSLIDGSWPDYDDQATGNLEFLGPWNSAIWRNVYTPFTYTEDFAIYIHMPRNVPGFDCRAHEIMANWMLSVPSVPRGDGFVEEVLPGNELYRDRLAEAEERVLAYGASVTGQHCPSDDDVLDPKVLVAPDKPGDPSRTLRPSPIDDKVMYGPRLDAAEIEGSGLSYFADGVPDHAHWVVADFSAAPGAWRPRRSDWKEVLTGSPAMSLPGDMGDVLKDLQNVRLSAEQEAFFLEPVPLGVWSESCSGSAPASSSPSVGELMNQQATPMNRWVTVGPFARNPVTQAIEPPPPSRRIHQMSRGQAVFETICQNCHGSDYDSKSPLATTIAELEGGQSIVADFRHGLFGPEEAPGAYANAVFTFSEGNQGLTPADWQARYILFMGMGGTLASVPKSVLDLISSSPFYGQVASSGQGLTGSIASPNMLQPAALKCRELLRKSSSGLRIDHGLQVAPELSLASPAFARGTGHYQLWESLCNYEQTSVIRVVAPATEGGRVVLKQPTNESLFFTQDRAGYPIYPSDAWVGDGLGNVIQGLSGDNHLPWCVRPTPVGVNPTDDDIVAYRASVDAWFAEDGTDQVPYCPTALFARVDVGIDPNTQLPLEGGLINEFPLDTVVGIQDGEAAARWFRKGAFNAGLAAYYYLDGLSKGLIEATPNWDSRECSP